MADKIISIKIKFNGLNVIGTLATVTFKPRFYKFWKKPYTKNYVCTKPAQLLSSEWVDIETGLRPDGRVVSDICYAAQDAARLAKLTTR